MESEWEGWSLEDCIKHQRKLIFGINLQKNPHVTEAEFLLRHAEYDRFTEWLWNRKEKND